MSYLTVAQCATDPDMADRVRAAWSQEGNPAPNTPLDLFWFVAGAADVEAAYASRVATGEPRPGADESAVTDGMILARVQAYPEDAPAP